MPSGERRRAEAAIRIGIAKAKCRSARGTYCEQKAREPQQ